MPDRFTMSFKYSGTCVLWTPWDQQKVSRLSRCPDFHVSLPDKAPFGTMTKYVDYVGVPIFKCPD